MVRSSPGNGLRTNRSAFVNRNRVRAQDQFHGSGRKVGKPQDRKVFMVEGFIVQQNRSCLVGFPVRKTLTSGVVMSREAEEPHFFYNRENPRFIIVVTIRANA